MFGKEATKIAKIKEIPPKKLIEYFKETGRLAD